VAADSTSTDGTLVYPTANGAQGVPTDLAVRIDGVERPVTAIEYADATGTLRPVTEWHLGPLKEFTLTLDSLTSVQPATFDVAVASTTSPVKPGGTLDVTVDVTNSGDESGTQMVTLDINNGVGQVDSASVSVSGGATTTQTLSWSVPSGATLQDYTATVSCADSTDANNFSVIELIDDFEDGDYNEYQVTNGSSSSVYVQDYPVYSGNLAIVLKPGGQNCVIESTSGLPRYPQVGDTIEFFFFMKRPARHIWNTTLGNLTIQINGRDNDGVFISTSNDGTIATGPLNLSDIEQTYVRCKVDLSSTVTVTFEVAGSTVFQESGSMSHTSFVDKISFGTFDTGDSRRAAWDAFRVIS